MLDVKGHFFLNKNRVWGSNIQYTVLVLKDRLIFMKTGGQFADTGAASFTGAALGGALGGFIGSTLDARRQQSKQAGTEDKIGEFAAMMEQQILRADKANFVLKLEEMGSITARKSGYNLAFQSPRSGILKIELPGRKPQQYDISKKSDYEESTKLLKQVMPQKIQMAPGRKQKSGYIRP